MNPPNNNKETRYGVPASYQVLYNRNYVLGYSYYFRQAKWALEVIDSSKSETTRANNFRPDYRIPERFRADLADYSSTGFDRGHLVSGLFLGAFFPEFIMKYFWLILAVFCVLAIRYSYLLFIKK
jgi:DNA/RNA endonuclease G (NUC1)